MTPGESPYRFEQTSGCSIISLLPELNEAQWADIERIGNEILARLSAVQSPAFLIDLSSLNYMGSAMVALIVRLWKSAKERNGNMVVVNRHELVLEVLKLAGLTKLWTIVDSREKGMAQLGVSGGVFAGEGGGSGVLALGAIAVVGAIAGLALQFSDSGGLGGKIAQAVEFGFAALGLVMGTMMLAREGSVMRRNIGIFVLVACVLVVLIGIIAAPTGAAPAPAGAAPAANATPAPTAAPAVLELKKNEKDKKDKDDEDSPAATAEKAAAGKTSGDQPAEKQESGGSPEKAKTVPSPEKDLKFKLNRGNE